MRLGGHATRGSTARLRTLVRIGAIAVGALVLLACASLVIVTTISSKDTEAVIRLNNGLRSVNDLRVELRKIFQADGLAYLAGDRRYELERARLVRDLPNRIATAHATVNDPQQRALLATAERQIAEYLALRKELVLRNESPRDVLLGSVAPVQAALGTFQEASRLGFDAASKAEGKQARRDLIIKILGGSIGLIGFAGFVFVGAGLRRFVFAPLLALVDGIDRFAAGDRSARVVPRGPAEVQHTADSFNEMAGSLERQHQDLLTFLAGVAHDLRNPLAAMQIGLQLLDPLRAQSEEKRRKTLDVVRRQMSGLERMVGDFLDAARIEGGHLELQLQLLDVRSLAQDAVELYASSSMKHRIIFSAPDTSVEVCCDGERIAQVLNNFVSNAIKYSPRGGDVLVSVAVEADESVVSVRDSGIGIAPADAEKIFEPFHRTGTSRETAPGVGLGLSVARRIVEAHHGRIDFDSTPGVGSTFCVRLPLAGSAPANTQSACAGH
jgi:signal transduction histidine kinase